MSLEKNRKEAQRWFETAEGDLETAVVLLANHRYAHACFHAQQCGEKAMKAVWYLVDEDPWGHSVIKLLQGLESVDAEIFEQLGHLEKSATILDRFYITTRYPNGLPDLTPDEAYLEEDALSCIEHATKIIDSVNSILTNSSYP